MQPNCCPVSDLSEVQFIAGIVEIELAAIRKNRICIISGLISFCNYNVRTIRDTGGPSRCVASPVKMRLSNGQLPPQRKTTGSLRKTNL